MPPELKKYTEANRAAWNEVTPLHQRAAREKWDRAFQQPGYTCLDQVELDLLNRLGVKGKAVAHLCCNNGVELMSLKNLGAARCVGFDISDEAVMEANWRADQCLIECEFVRTDVYDIGAEYDNQFDLIYISVGCLGWMPDLPRFFQKAAGLLKENGRVFIYEAHPFAEMLPLDDDKDADPLRIVESYFKAEPYVEIGGLDYLGNAQYEAKTTQYWFVHKLSDIINGMIANHIWVEHFSEYEKCIGGVNRRIEDTKAGVPLSYIMIGRKHHIVDGE
jgi:SAM-dependent methyltransferase